MPSLSLIDGDAQEAESHPAWKHFSAGLARTFTRRWTCVMEIFVSSSGREVFIVSPPSLPTIWPLTAPPPPVYLVSMSEVRAAWSQTRCEWQSRVSVPGSACVTSTQKRRTLLEMRRVCDQSSVLPHITHPPTVISLFIPTGPRSRRARVFLIRSMEINRLAQGALTSNFRYRQHFFYYYYYGSNDFCNVKGFACYFSHVAASFDCCRTSLISLIPKCSSLNPLYSPPG